MQFSCNSIIRSEGGEGKTLTPNDAKECIAFAVTKEKQTVFRVSQSNGS